MKNLPYLLSTIRPLSLSMALGTLLAFAACESSPEVHNGDGDGDGLGGDSGDGDGDGDLVLPGDGDGDGDGDEDYVCGNGDLEPGELCDDGGVKDGDGCSGDCQKQDPDYDCSIPGEACRDTVVCGNGVIEGDEVCDEGSDNRSDGCSKECDAISEGWSCPRPGRMCVELPVCGNGIRERGEQCDDKEEEPSNGDGCSAECQEEDPDAYFCVPGFACVELNCGDGKRTPNEECDDGGNDSGDGCSQECNIEEGFHCSAIKGCRAICGDGILIGNPLDDPAPCDDGNRESGDGCSAACVVEPFFDCTGAPSECQSTIICGDGEVGPGEVCDPCDILGGESCQSDDCVLLGDEAGIPCTAKNEKIEPAICNGLAIEFGEECDGDGGLGGCVDCQIEEGYACPKAGYCFLIPECGDGLIQSGEECDPGSMSSEACNACEISDGWFCAGEPSDCKESDCGDGLVDPDEQCDDGGTASGDGCSPTCQVDGGWVCPPGIDCQPVCGDGKLEGEEQCDVSHAGCVECRLQPGYDCGNDGKSCAATACGNGDPDKNMLEEAEAGEGCDDGNTVAGDGCGPTCQVEPVVTVGPNPTVEDRCGDGMRSGLEECDDGNAVSGDGCSATCELEDGWTCEDQLTLPDLVDLKIKYRDFKDFSETGGHPHMKERNVGAGGTDKEITGEVCFYNSSADNNLSTCGRLDTEGKPILNTSVSHPTIYDFTGSLDGDDVRAFELWYRDTNESGLVGPDGVVEIAEMGEDDYLSLTRIDDGGGNPTEAYVFDSNGNTFYPLDNNESEGGFGNTPKPSSPSHNWHFTSEIRYFFQYKPGQELQFYGDDDVWVYVNGALAVDIGGIHGQQSGSVVLGEDGDSADTADDRFGLTEGELYEIVIFQAERHPTGSNYKLTLDGFIAPRSFCSTDCGDGTIAGTELCDDGDDDNEAPSERLHGECTSSCDFSFCGDSVVQNDSAPGALNGAEHCDNGLNVDTYDKDGQGCAPGCVQPDYCGDGILQASANEECDNGTGQNDDSYGGCDSDCKLAPYCGDGLVNGSGDNEELCDTPGEFVPYRDGEKECGFDCHLAPYCGDGIRNGDEHCERFPEGGGEDTYCDATTCTYSLVCGDALPNPEDPDEECDYGQFGFDGSAEDTPYGGCNLTCELGPTCGDSALQDEYEECDEGSEGNTGEYDGCTSGCTLGPHCGDGVRQSEEGELCDNGFNDDIYAFNEDSCAPGCRDVPYCGNGGVESLFELCDNGADNDDDSYDGCTTQCDWGPFCGDGQVDEGFESCDLGGDNSSYSADGEGCGYDCKPAPYCGDGERNGPEDCDLGTADNQGEYGTCNEDCTNTAYCGDGIRQKEAGEACDDGPIGSLDCSVTCRRRAVIK